MLELAQSLLCKDVQFHQEVMVMKRLMLALVMVAIAGAGAACNTVRGMGQDVERAGEKTQDAAENVQKRM